MTLCTSTILQHATHHGRELKRWQAVGGGHKTETLCTQIHTTFCCSCVQCVSMVAYRCCKLISSFNSTGDNSHPTSLYSHNLNRCWCITGRGVLSNQQIHSTSHAPSVKWCWCARHTFFCANYGVLSWP